MAGVAQSPLEGAIPHAIRGNLENKISPSILVIIIIVAIIFFISGLLHLLVRLVLKPNSREADGVDEVTALQGQLQQLFYLHDAGVDQSFIDNLPLFHYGSVIGGVKDPFDCAVCLCEFEPDDRLRLLPKCSHAFHTQCIDTWLLSHSTCPLCRSNLLDGISPARSSRFPILCVLESASDAGSDRHDFDDSIVTVKLGKFKNIDEEQGSTSTNVVDSRRCYSMGSFAYIMDDTSSLQVPIITPARKPRFLPRSAISEYACDSTRDFQVEPFVTRPTEFNLNLNLHLHLADEEEDKQSSYSLDSTTTATTTTTKRTLNWLMGGRHHNKIVNSSSTNV